MMGIVAGQLTPAPYPQGYIQDMLNMHEETCRLNFTYVWELISSEPIPPLEGRKIEKEEC